MYDSYDSEDGSFVKIETSVVREACQKTIASITTYRQKSDDRQIADAVASNATYHKYFWWLGVRLESREEIVKVLNWRVVFFPSIYAYDSLERAESLLVMCDNSADGFILMSRKDHAAVFNDQERVGR